MEDASRCQQPGGTEKMTQGDDVYKLPQPSRRSALPSLALGTCLALAFTAVGAAQGVPAPGRSSTEGATLDAAAQVQAPVPHIAWQRCIENARLRCGTAQVPLDYEAPNGPKISLNLVKRPADLPEQKLGSLFVNPGGPGGSAADFADYAAAALGEPVRQRFDVIGIDPRGVGDSTLVTCETRAGDPGLPPLPSEAFPRGERQVQEWLAYDEAVRRVCRTGGSAVLDHMTTADTARDMDLIRQAVGDPMLNYYGISYGTQLGSTYAAMFPGRVRSMVLDAVLDPVEWTSGRFGRAQKYTVSARLNSGYGAWEALTSALAECDRVGRLGCPQAGSIAREWERVVAKLRQGAVRAGGQRITYANVIGTLLGGLYDARSYPQIMRFIDDVYKLISAPSPGAADAAARSWVELNRIVAEAGGTEPRYAAAGAALAAAAPGQRIFPEFQGVLCSDSVNPAEESRAIASARYANRQGPGFGALWAWASSVCINWPGSGADAYRGPWRTQTANPVLITGNVHDPATPISGARAVNKLFPGSVLVTVNTWGHGALGKSRCVTSKWDTYFVTGRLPAPGLVCQPDRALFPK